MKSPRAAISEWLTLEIFLPDSSNGMTIKTRNRLIVLFIFAFPFIVITGFLILDHYHPTPPPALTGTNFIHSPR